MLRTVGLLLTLLAAGSCIVPYEPNIEPEEFIVIDGMITDQPGPYTINLFKTKPVNNQFEKLEKIIGATLTLSDDAGNTDVLTELSDGVYLTTSAQGVVGRTYSLNIKTKDRSEYQSAPTEMLPVGEIDSIHFHFEMNEQYIPIIDADSTGQISTTNGFRISVDATVNPGQQKRVRWRWSGTFELLSHPEESKHPPACAGPPCICCRCWVTQHNHLPIIKKTEEVAHVFDQELAFVPAMRLIFYRKYYFGLDQLSLSEDEYRFWSNVRASGQLASDLFQTGAPRTVGNMKAVTPGAQKMIGYFSVSSIKSKVIEIFPSDIPYVLQLETRLMQCDLLYFPDSHRQKPPFY